MERSVKMMLCCVVIVVGLTSTASGRTVPQPSRGPVSRSERSAIVVPSPSDFDGLAGGFDGFGTSDFGFGFPATAYDDLAAGLPQSGFGFGGVHLPAGFGSALPPRNHLFSGFVAPTARRPAFSAAGSYSFPAPLRFGPAVAPNTDTAHRQATSYDNDGINTTPSPPSAGLRAGPVPDLVLELRPPLPFAATEYAAANANSPAAAAAPAPAPAPATAAPAFDPNQVAGNAPGAPGKPFEYSSSAVPRPGGTGNDAQYANANAVQTYDAKATAPYPQPVQAYDAAATVPYPQPVQTYDAAAAAAPYPQPVQTYDTAANEQYRQPVQTYDAAATGPYRQPVQSYDRGQSGASGPTTGASSPTAGPYAPTSAGTAGQQNSYSNAAAADFGPAPVSRPVPGNAPVPYAEASSKPLLPGKPFDYGSAPPALSRPGNGAVQNHYDPAASAPGGPGPSAPSYDQSGAGGTGPFPAARGPVPSGGQNPPSNSPYGGNGNAAVQSSFNELAGYLATAINGKFAGDYFNDSNSVSSNDKRESFPVRQMRSGKTT